MLDNSRFKLQEPLGEGPIVARAVEFLYVAIKPLPSAFSVVLNEASSKIKGEAITHSSCYSLIQALSTALNAVVLLVRYLLETLKTISNDKLDTLGTDFARKIKKTVETLFSEADLQAYLHPTTLDEEVKCLSSIRSCSVSVLAQWLWPIWRYVMTVHVVVLACANYIDMEQLTFKCLACLEFHELGESFNQVMASSAKKNTTRSATRVTLNE
ncbi:hypothetical protein FHL15_006512 [Xylaria flabelliformis]|uniref:Uncharacterized protein n=1 Tax=Xylaria flabelliformis TaxID=2512241 RepID=A0A553HXA4_9PEZI|nr:hypothetical protein FHL15_006512 [Xylaria flabelliformis]